MLRYARPLSALKEFSSVLLLLLLLFPSYPKLMPYVVWRPQGSGKNILLAGVIYAWFLGRLKYSDSGSCI